MVDRVEDRVGQSLGNYRMLRLLGRGGFASVYLGEHSYLKSHAALKVLHTHLSEEDAAKFLQEAQTLARLTHPYIVRVLDFAVQDGMPFLVMEYAPHGTLRQHHVKETPLPLETIVSYVQQVASALQYAHDQRLMHRDVKPENMLLNERSQVLLSDFGLSIYLPQTLSGSSQEMAQPMAGTVLYMAPEQIQGKPRAASDQYALAVVVYEWLCGKPPFNGSLFEVARQHLWVPPPSLREQVPDLSPALEAVVLRALAKAPKERFASVQDFAFAFEHACGEALSPSATYMTTPASSIRRDESQSIVEGTSWHEQVRKGPVPSTPLVGRKLEWAQLQAAWQSAAAGQPQLLVLSGEAGIGKTRLAEELLVEVSWQGIATASARCYAAEGELAYTPVAAWLRAEALHRSLVVLAGVWLTEVARLMPELLVERPALPPPGLLTEGWQRQRWFEALARAILAGHRPVLLLLDDMQWCDQETLTFLHYLLRFDPQERLLIVGTLRSEELVASHSLESLLVALRRDHQVTEIALKPFDAAETAMLAGYVTGRNLSQALAANLYQATEGNPLFVVESLRMGVGEQEGLEHQPSDQSIALPSVVLPSTVQAVIAARFEQLSSTARELASIAAVIGRAFSFDVLKRASGSEEDVLVQGLDELWQRRIIREQGTESYDFSHDKLREGAYAGLSRARRRLLHRRVAEALEAVYADDADALNTVSGQIAVHYEHGGVVERAIRYYRQAAEAARQVYANAEAIASYKRALALLEATPRSEAKREMLAQLYESVGNLLDLTGQWDAARAAYQSALTFVPQHELIWQARLYRQIGGTELQHEKELHYFDIAEALLGKGPTDDTPAWRHEWIEHQLLRMRLYYNWAKLPELVALVQKERPIIEQYGNPTQRARFFSRLAMVTYRRDRYVSSEETLQHHQAASAASQESEDSNAIATAQFELGFGYLWHDELDRAEEQFQTALPLAERTGNRLLQGRCLTYLTIVYRKRGELENVGRYASQALAIATAIMMTEYISMARGNMAWVAWREGNMAEAQKHGQAALETFDPGEEPFMWTALWPLIGVAIVQDNLSDAIKYTRILLVPVQQRLPDELTAPLEAAIQAWDPGEPETARNHLHRAVALAREMRYL